LGVILFLFALLSFILALNVLRPIYHHPKLMVFSFLAGWPVGELALHVIAVQAAILGSVVYFGELSGTLDMWSAVLLFLSWGMLAYHYFSGFKSLTQFQSFALNESFLLLDIKRLIRPFNSIKDKGIVVDKNILYREVDGMRLKLDIRRKNKELKGAPVLLQIHGGGWTRGYGSKNEQALPLMQNLAQQGWVCVAINYRLSPKATFPDHIIDCEHALAWVKDNIADYGGDPDFIIVTGGSAGGHLSSLLSLSTIDHRFDESLKDKDLRVQGCVPFYGIYDLLDEKKLQKSVGLEIVMRKSIVKQRKEEAPDLYRIMSPINHISKHAPPFLIIHGNKDTLTSFDEARYFSNKLRSVSGQQVSFAAIDGAQHAFDIFPSLRCDIVVAGISAELKQWHESYQKTL